MQDMLTSDELTPEYLTKKIDIFQDMQLAKDEYHKAMQDVFNKLKGQSPPTEHCTDENQDTCNEIRLTLWSNVVADNFNVERRTYFYLHFTPVCNNVTLPTPYLDNKVITMCLKAEATAKQVAEKSVRQAVSGVVGGKRKAGTRKTTCKHVSLGPDGGKQEKKIPCLNLDEGSNLVKCFFEIHGAQTFSVDYKCFYPALWKTWFLSFKKVYNAMQQKGFTVNTPRLQQRRCFYDAELYHQDLTNKNVPTNDDL